MIKTKRNHKKNSMLSLMLVFTFLLASIPLQAFAATPIMKVTRFQFIQEVDSGKTKNIIEISGFNFREYINNNPVDVVRSITINSGTSTTTLENIRAAGGKVDITETLIRIEAPTTGPTTLGMNTNGETIITMTGRDQPEPIQFSTNVNALPSIGSSFVESKLYAGQSVEIEGTGFEGVTDFVVAGASHTPTTTAGAGRLTINFAVNPNKMMIDSLQKNILGAESSLIIKKQNTTTINGVEVPVIFSVDYKKRVTVFDRLSGMDNLLVLPSQGPISRSSLITVYSMNQDGTAKLLNKFTDKMRIYLRKSDDPTKEVMLQNVELKYEKVDGVDSVVGISGYTPLSDPNKEQDKLYHVVIRDPANLLAEGVKKNAYTFVTGDPSPSIAGLYPGEGPSTGGTDVTILGRNIVNIATSGISFPNGVSIVPQTNPVKEGNETLLITYDINGETATNKAKYGGQNIKGIQRRIKTKISLYTTPKEVPLENRKLQTSEYGSFHFSTITEDGIVAVTPNANVDGPQVVILEIETTLTLADGTTITIPEGARYSSFIYKEVEPRPVIQSVEPPYGYYNYVADNQKPLMIRIKGAKFQGIKQPNSDTLIYPEVTFRLPNGDTLPVTISNQPGDIKILSNGAQIDGQYKTLGDTMVVSIIPNGDLKTLILKEPLQPDGYRYLYGIIEVKNPQGGTNIFNTEGVKFEFRHPDDVIGSTEVHSKQPIISQVLLNGNVPVTKLSSDRDNEVEIKFTTRAGLSDLSKVKVTIDGMDITNKIISRKNDGDNAVIKVSIPKGIVGKTRLQLILYEGLMDSYNITFDNLLGPEIKEITPDSGDAGTIAVIKRDTEANTIGFKPAIETSNDEQERRGTRVLINGEDINLMFEGYDPVDGISPVDYQKSDYFTNFTKPGEDLMLPGKYVYVVDADTIYVKFPETIDPGKYTIQIRNPDGSESASTKIFTVLESIAKTEIGTIDPAFDDETGGIITTITAANGTNFKGEVDVFFGSQKGTVVGYNLDYTKVYVKVPPLKDYTFPNDPTNPDKIESFTVPVTVANKVNKSTDTKSDGFTYTNPNYTVKITRVYKEGMTPTDPNANKVNVGDYIWIDGENFRGTVVNGTTVENLPVVLFGYTKVQAEDYDIMNMGTDRAELSRIKVKVPPKPINAAADGSVDIVVQNYDGAKAMKAKAVIYASGNPVIDEKASTLRARKTGERIEVFAKEVFEDGLMVAFGNTAVKQDIGNKPVEIETQTEQNGLIENIVVKYIPGQADNIEIYYKDPSGNLTLMTDATLLNGKTETATNGKLSLGNDPGVVKIIGINWQNPAYHKATQAGENPDALKTFNKEYMYIKTIQEGSNNYLEVRRGLGKIESFKIDKLNNSVIGIQTPYHDKIEMSTITLINLDGSSATAPFEFHGGLDAPVITDLEGSKERNVMIDGTQQKVKVKTQDYTVDGTMKILGKNFKDVQSVKIGTKDVKIESISPDYTYMIVSVPKGEPGEVGKPLQVTVVTKEGNAFSSKTVPPVYFMYIAADSKPVIETITPAVGPRTGGTLVTITGKGFREKDEFGVVSDKVEERITITVNGSMPAGLKSTTKNEQGEIVELKVIMPPSVTGTAKLQVINADGGTSEPKEFIYISQPKISKTEGSIFFNDTESIIKLFGEDFQSGAKVIIGATQTKGKKPADATISGMIEVTADGQNQQAHLTGGVQAADVQVTGSNQITFKMPAGIESLDNTTIIIVNPDSGMSGPGTGTIKPPIPDVPKIEATPGFERSIILRWTVDKEVLNAAEKFEIYVKERSANEYTFVGDTKQDTTTQTYVIKGLKYNTTYDVKVRVMNKYGEATDLGTARTTTLSQSEDYKEKEKQEAVDKAVDKIVTEGKQEIIGDTLYYTVGTTENNIDISKTTAKNKTKYVQIPVKEIKAGSKSIIITDKDMTLSVNYSSLNVSELRNAPDDAVFRFKISTADKQIEESLNSAIPRSLKRASNVYAIYFELVQPKLVTPISSLSSSATFNINSSAYPKYNAVYIESADTFSILQSNSITQGGYYVLLTNKQ